MQLLQLQGEKEKISRDLEKKQLELDSRRREIEEQRPQGLGWYFENYATPLIFRQLFSVFFLFGLLLLTLFGIAEVHQRQVLNRWLRGQSDQLRDQVAITGTPVGQVVEERRQKLDVAQRDIEALSFAGASRKDRTLHGIATSLTETASGSGSGFVTSGNTASWTEYVYFIQYWNSDLLLSLAIHA